MEKVTLKLAEFYQLEAELNGVTNQQTGEVVSKGLLSERVKLTTKYWLVDLAKKVAAEKAAEEDRRQKEALEEDKRRKKAELEALEAEKKRIEVLKAQQESSRQRLREVSQLLLLKIESDELISLDDSNSILNKVKEILRM